MNNILKGLMLLPANKRHSILKLLMTASTLATAKGHEMRTLGITDESYVRLEVADQFIFWNDDRILCWTCDFWSYVIDGMVDTWMDGGRFEHSEIMRILPSCEKSTETDV